MDSVDVFIAGVVVGLAAAAIAGMFSFRNPGGDRASRLDALRDKEDSPAVRATEQWLHDNRYQ